MMVLVLITAAFASAIGIAVLCINPQRLTNRAFAAFSLLFLVHSLLLFGALEAGSRSAVDSASDPIPWIRANAAVNGFIPLGLWLIREGALVGARDRRRMLLGSATWMTIGVGLVYLCYHESFIPYGSPQDDPQRGIAYTLRTTILIGALSFLVLDTAKLLRSLSGIQLVEIRFVTLTGAIVAISSIVLLSLSSALRIPEFRGLALAIVLIGYAVMAWAMTVHRVFDVREVFLSFGQRATMVMIVVSAGYGFAKCFEGILNPIAAVVVSIALSCLFIARLDRSVRRWLGIGGEEILSGVRAEALRIANTSNNSDLVSSFEELLRRHCGTSFAAVMDQQRFGSRSEAVRLEAKRPAFSALCFLGWATPESVERRRLSVDIADLGAFLRMNRLGLLVAVPTGSKAPSLIIALGEKSDRWPYTFPEVQRLQSLAELMDNILAHARLTAQAALRSKVEDLAIVSRGLAHDLKNLITPVSSFLVHAESGLRVGTPEADVHAAARRSIELMTDYIGEALFFARRFEPRFEKISLQGLLETVRTLTSIHASRRQVRLYAVSPGEMLVTVDAVLIKRLLINLVMNAVDASAPGKEVRIVAERFRARDLRIEVRDEGCGIGPEQIKRVFEPYYTTKNFGDQERGFGLGLTICQKIAELHHGEIGIASRAGKGTTVTVDLPAAAGDAGVALEPAPRMQRVLGAET